MNKGEDTPGHYDMVGDDFLFGDMECRVHIPAQVGNVDAGKIAE